MNGAVAGGEERRRSKGDLAVAKKEIGKPRPTDTAFSAGYQSYSINSRSSTISLLLQAAFSIVEHDISATLPEVMETMLL